MGDQERVGRKQQASIGDQLLESQARPRVRVGDKPQEIPRSQLCGVIHWSLIIAYSVQWSMRR